MGGSFCVSTKRTEPLLPVILNGAAGGVKDLMYDNVQEMYPPDSSLSLRMTERALGMTGDAQNDREEGMCGMTVTE